jgi:uncharacterized protein with NAD-binding domain and iron-sulfur cluster
MANPERKKVAILGGGVASMTTAWELTSPPDWRERFESVTVYQLGWRLGGKCASGRGLNARIEEHGLHVWMGWYANAFRVIRAAYAELGRPAGAPLATWDEAFKRHGFIALGEQVDGEWTNWPLWFPLTDDTPGQGGEYPTLYDYVEETLKGLYGLLEGKMFVAPPPAPREPGWRGIVHSAGQFVENACKAVADVADVVALECLLREARDAAGEMRRHPEAHSPQHDEALAVLLDRVRERLVRHLESRLERDAELRRLFCVADVALACVIGVLREDPGLGAHSLDALDGYDFREFLRKHGAVPTSVDSPLVRAFYDLLFAYRDGHPDDQRMAAGVSLRFIFRMMVTYEGAIFWKMQAGMADTVFTPLYEVLKRRGVRFEFFHDVQRLELAEDRKSVARIHVGRQATTKSGTYRPLIEVKGLACWPSEPHYDQLVEGEALREQHIDLESYWTPWRSTPTVLERGRDFDLIVFGISLGAIPSVAGELVEASPRWRAMVENVETVRTQAVQLWLRPDLAGLGWTLPSPVADAYPDPLDTWADMSHLIPRERWPAGFTPGNLAYYCSAMPGGIPPPSDHGVPARAAEEVKQAAIGWLNRYAGIQWPEAIAPGGGFDWSLLIDERDRGGETRFDAQYWRANVDPSERYVQSMPGSTRYRLRANDPDFDNLFVTGDWIYCGINAGCVEATVMSAMLTANAICGLPRLKDIIGYDNP